MAGTALVFIHMGTTQFDAMNTLSVLFNSYTINVGDSKTSLIELACSLFVIGGGVKSAQFGFHI